MRYSGILLKGQRLSISSGFGPCLSPFSTPHTARWFTDTFGTPTAAQERGWAPIRERQDTLIAAPTGSGKTLAAFLTALDDLLQEGLRAPLPDEVRVVYVSPLKALSADIHKNLSEPRRGIRRVAEELGLEAPRITAAVRTGDTPQAERTAMLRKPPHVLVTTPESLYLLLTAERSREMLRTVRTVIVDEIHAVIGTRRGAHLALSLERLQQVADGRLLRLGLSATQKPIEEVARFLVGTRAIDPDGRASCAIVDEGHRRDDGPRPRAARLAARSRDVARGLGGVLRPADGADWRAPHHDCVREYPADGRTPGALLERAARRRRRDGAPWEPVEGKAPGRGDAAERRDSSKHWSRRPRSSWGSTSVTSIWCARSDRRTVSPRSFSASGGPGIPCRVCPRAGCSPPRATI